MALAREARAAKKAAAVEAAVKDIEERKEAIRIQLPKMAAMWQRSFDIAMRENTDAAWRKAEQLMVNYVSMKSSLEKI